MDTDTETSNEKEDNPPTNTTVVKPSKPTKTNGKVGKSNYTREELLALFSVMERILPIGTEEWEQVVLDHSEQYPGRDVDSIRRKYNSLHRKQVPTGSPNMTPEIRAAKRIKCKIGEKADIGGGEEEVFELETGFADVDDINEGEPPAPGDQPPPVNVVNLVDVEGDRVARGPSPAISAVTAVSSRVARRKPANTTHNDFMEFMKSQVVMEREMRRIEREERRVDEENASRKRVEEWTAIVGVLLGGVASICGLEAPNPQRKKSKRDDCSDEE